MLHLDQSETTSGSDSRRGSPSRNACGDSRPRLSVERSSTSVATSANRHTCREYPHVGAVYTLTANRLTQPALKSIGLRNCPRFNPRASCPKLKARVRCRTSAEMSFMRAEKKSRPCSDRYETRFDSATTMPLG